MLFLALTSQPLQAGGRVLGAPRESWGVGCSPSRRDQHCCVEPPAPTCVSSPGSDLQRPCLKHALCRGCHSLALPVCLPMSILCLPIWLWSQEESL